MDSIFKKPTSLFIRAKVRDLLFDGLYIDCTGKDFAANAVCSEVRPQYHDFGLKLVQEDEYMMSLWGTVRELKLKY